MATVGTEGQRAWCLVCGAELHWHSKERGWVHDGGGSVMRFCRNCGYETASYPPCRTCPRCVTPKFIKGKQRLLSVPMMTGHLANATFRYREAMANKREYERRRRHREQRYLARSV
jgi:hypothetical protein